jgi:hypothetical protein
MLRASVSRCALTIASCAFSVNFVVPDTLLLTSLCALSLRYVFNYRDPRPYWCRAFSV